jgi:hypothetical protein
MVNDFFRNDWMILVFAAFLLTLLALERGMYDFHEFPNVPSFHFQQLS